MSKFGFWDQLMAEQGVKSEGLTVLDQGPDYIVYGTSPNFNVGDVLVGEIVEEG